VFKNVEACAAYPLNQKAQDTLSWYEKSYQNLTQQLVDSGRYDSTDDFTVVVQPFFKDFLAPRTSDGKVDLSFFAPDCFHLSAKSHGSVSFNKREISLFFL
jgi:phospholipase B1